MMTAVFAVILIVLGVSAWFVNKLAAKYGIGNKKVDESVESALRNMKAQADAGEGHAIMTLGNPVLLFKQNLKWRETAVASLERSARDDAAIQSFIDPPERMTGSEPYFPGGTHRTPLDGSFLSRAARETLALEVDESFHDGSDEDVQWQEEHELEHEDGFA